MQVQTKDYDDAVVISLLGEMMLGNEAQDLKDVIQMDKDKYQNAILFEEKRQIILSEPQMKTEIRNNMMADLEAQFPGSRNALNSHNRESEETLKATVELELHEIKYEWLPDKLPGGALGPMIAVVTMEETKAN